jgi:hypothetical protein
MNSFEDYYIVKHNSKIFEPNTIVKFITCSDSGNCYLISDLNDDYKREWIMYYDLYPVGEINENKHLFNEKFNEIALKFINDNKK